ncbi:unnamed protein product, partial [Amoebophrya sp. A120]
TNSTQVEHEQLHPPSASCNTTPFIVCEGALSGHLYTYRGGRQAVQVTAVLPPRTEEAEEEVYEPARHTNTMRAGAHGQERSSRTRTGSSSSPKAGGSLKIKRKETPMLKNKDTRNVKPAPRFAYLLANTVRQKLRFHFYERSKERWKRFVTNTTEEKSTITGSDHAGSWSCPQISASTTRGEIITRNLQSVMRKEHNPVIRIKLHQYDTAAAARRVVSVAQSVRQATGTSAAYDPAADVSLSEKKREDLFHKCR